MASPLEMLQLGQQFDPYGSFRQGGMEAQQYDVKQGQLDLQQQALKQAQQDMAPAANAQPLAGMAGGIAPAGGKAQPLGAMAGNMLGPQYKLTTPDGDLTSAGLVNQTLMTAQLDEQQAQKAKQQANYYNAMGKPELAQQAEQEYRRLLTSAQNNKQNAQKQKTEAKDDFMSALYGAKSQEDYDQRLRDAIDRTGTPKPENLPDTWSPDLKDKFLSKMSPTMRQKVEAETRAEEASKRAARALEMKEIKNAARDQGNLTGGEDLTNDKAIGQFVAKLNKVSKTKQVDLGTAKSTFSQIAPEYRADLNTVDAIKDVSGKLGVAQGAYDISNFIAENKIKTGRIGELKKTIDSLSVKSPDSYPTEASINSVVKNQELSKKILDFANAYARAESGSNRATIAELKAAISRFGEAGMSGQSAEQVFKMIGEDKVKQVAREHFGGDEKAIQLKGGPRQRESVPEKTSGGATVSNW